MINIKDLFLNDFEDNRPRDTALNTGFIKEYLEDPADKAYEEYSGLFDIAEKFYNGSQWEWYDGDYDLFSKRTVYIDGKPVYTVGDVLGNRQNSGKYTKRVINLIQYYVENKVAMFTEVKPTAIAKSISEYEPIDELATQSIHYNNLLLKSVFQDENKFELLYQKIVREALIKGQAIIQLHIDEDKNFTNTPVKFRLIDSRNIRVDPEAENIDEADYVIQFVEMRYLDLLNKYDYKYQGLEKNEPKYNDKIKIKIIWLRQKDRKGQNKWISLTTYNGQWIRLKNERGKSITNLNNYTLPILPFVVFRTKITKSWHGEGLIDIHTINSQIDLNMTRAEGDYYWRMLIDPPIITDLDPDLIDNGNIPGGCIPIDRTRASVSRFPISELSVDIMRYREEAIKRDFELVFGNTELMEGRKPVGTYSNVLLETLIELNEMRPRMMERLFIDSIKDLAKKTLRLLADYKNSYTLYDPEGDYNTPVTIESAKHILNNIIKIDIEVSDINLMKPDSILNIINSLNQYSRFAEKMHPYYIARMVNNHLPGVIPDDIEEALKADLEAILAQNIKATTMPTAEGIAPLIPTEGAPIPPTAGGTIPMPENIPTGMPTEEATSEAGGMPAEQETLQISNIPVPQQEAEAPESQGAETPVPENLLEKEIGTELDNRLLEVWLKADEIRKRIKDEYGEEILNQINEGTTWGDYWVDLIYTMIENGVDADRMLFILEEQWEKLENVIQNNIESGEPILEAPLPREEEE